MATWADPLGDLRRLLADTPNDNLVKNKVIPGDWSSGQHRTFYTFDDRLLASGNQSVCGKPLRVFYGGVELAASGILVTDQIRGEFQLMVVPSGTQKKLTASYFYQKNLDNELEFDLQQGANQVSAATAADVVAGLQLSALQIAASLAHTRMATRWIQRKSQQFMMEDEPARKEAEELIRFHQDEAERLMKAGIAARKAYFEDKLDQAKSPAFRILKRTPRPYTPRR